MTNISHADDEIRIPRTLWLAEGLSLREKALLADIGAADPALGYRATNTQIGRLIGVRERQVRECLNDVRKKGFISTRVNPDQSRVIKTTAKLAKLMKGRAKRSGR